MEEDEALPAGWRVAQDTKGRTYYYNKQLNLKQWGRPQPPIRGFHRQASAREPSPMRQPPAIPHWGLDETTEPGLADALRPLVRELRPRLLWALADGHRQQLELVWPELGALLPAAPAGWRLRHGGAPREQGPAAAGAGRRHRVAAAERLSERRARRCRRPRQFLAAVVGSVERRPCADRPAAER